MGEEGTPKTEMINPALLDGVSANFIVKGPSGVEKAYPMKSITVTIGRSDQCDIAVKDSSMSGKHAEISKINGEIRVKDLGSANGIWLNGERVDDVELFDGDVLRCGQTSIRVDVVGGRKRPDAGLSPKVLAAIIAGVLVLAGAGIGGGLWLKKKQQRKRDLKSLAQIVESTRSGQKANPCGSGTMVVQDLVEQRTQVGQTFINDWKKLAQATATYANVLDQAFLQGNKGAYAAVDAGVAAKSPADVVVQCSKNFGKTRNAVEDKCKEMEE